MKLKLPKYTSKDYLVLALVLLPISFIINSAVLQTKYFSNWKIFVTATILAAIGFSLNFTLCGAVAVLMKKRFPLQKQVGRKLTFMILTFFVITGLFLLLIFKGYEKISFFNYVFNEHGFVWAYIGMGIVNTFLTLLFEGIDRYENWSANLKETEKLKNVFKQSQLQGLKSQLNPHFLFNSLNSLSSLISEDEEEAEKFLNEMSKVYRYMLRNEEDQLVTLETELKFTDSYMYLLRARYGDGLQLNVEVSEKAKTKYMPPLTLQVLIENAFTQNSINKSDPLRISIVSKEDQTLIVRNNIQPKVVTEVIDAEAELDNLINKYQLLNQPQVLIEEGKKERTIRIPLINEKEEVVF